MPLSAVAVQHAKPREKEYKLADERGLYLLVTPNGGKHWRFKYRFAGKERKLSFGSFPDVSLANARERRDDTRRVIAGGIDPVSTRKQQVNDEQAREEEKFNFVADEWLRKLELEERAESTLSKMRWIVDFARPVIGHKLMSEIAARDLLSVLRPIEARKRYETANRARGTFGTIFRYAIAIGKARYDPSRDLHGALIRPKVNHRAAIVEPRHVGALLRAVAGYEGAPSVKLALWLLAHLFVRPGELRLAEWQEFDLRAKVWTIPGTRTKMRRPHRVPLSRQVVALLADLEAVSDDSKLLFPSLRSKERAMSDNTLNAALRRLGYDKSQMTAHGFRATASSLLNESGKWHPDAIERQLAHVENNDVRRAYLRGEHWEERIKMMQWWSDHLIKLYESGNIGRSRR